MKQSEDAAAWCPTGVGPPHRMLSERVAGQANVFQNRFENWPYEYMFAVIKTGGKQYLVEPGEKLKIEKLDAIEGSTVMFDTVLLLGNETKTEIGMPYVAGAKVEAHVLKQGRAKKLIVFHYHSKTRHRKKAGHRQPFTEVEIKKITK